MSSTPSNWARGSLAYGAARRARAKSESTLRGPSTQTATSCCASTSRGLAGTRVASTAPSCIARVMAAVDRRSPRYLGKITPRDTAPAWWPARPMRCIPAAALGGRGHRLPQARHVLHRDLDLQVEGLALGGIDDRHRARTPGPRAFAAAEIAGDLVERTLGRGQPHPLRRLPSDLGQALER